MLSETFLKALRGLSRYDGRASVRTWLCCIARHAWIDEVRRRRPTLSYDDLLDDYLVDEASDPARFEAEVDNKALAAQAQENRIYKKYWNKYPIHFVETIPK